MAGYSKNSLVKKLGIVEGNKLLLVNIPDHYDSLIIDRPESTSTVEMSDAKDIDFVHFFTQNMAELEVMFPQLKSKLKRGGGLWISWPKGSSMLAKDLNGNDVRSVGLVNGLVDVKVCAIDKDWSGLKFMFRTKS